MTSPPQPSALSGGFSKILKPTTPRLKAALAVLQRPHYPNQGWHLPERIESPRQQQVIDTLAEIKAEFEVMRMQNALAKGTDAS